MGNTTVGTQGTHRRHTGDTTTRGTQEAYRKHTGGPTGGTQEAHRRHTGGTQEAHNKAYRRARGCACRRAHRKAHRTTLKDNEKLHCNLATLFGHALGIGHPTSERVLPLRAEEPTRETGVCIFPEECPASTLPSLGTAL